MSDLEAQKAQQKAEIARQAAAAKEQGDRVDAAKQAQSDNQQSK